MGLGSVDLKRRAGEEVPGGVFGRNLLQQRVVLAGDLDQRGIGRHFRSLSGSAPSLFTLSASLDVVARYRYADRVFCHRSVCGAQF